MKEISNNSRRDFLKKAGMILGASITIIPLSSMLNSCEKDQIVPPAPPPPATGIPVDLRLFPGLNTAGTTLLVSVTVSGAKYNYIVKREKVSTPVGTDDFIILDPLCTHKMAAFDLPTTPEGNLVCSLHQAEFYTTTDKKGQVASNPNGVSPLTNLSWYKYNYDTASSTLYILGKGD